MIHFFSALIEVLSHKRVCPKCGRAQVVKLSQKNTAVPRKYCSTSIPSRQRR